MDYSFLITEMCNEKVVGSFLFLFVAHDAVGKFKGRISKIVPVVC